jgi:hypothetical protein
MLLIVLLAPQSIMALYLLNAGLQNKVNSINAARCTTYRNKHLLLTTANTTLYTANTMTPTGSAAG